MKTIDEYIQNSPAEVQDKLIKLRKTIREEIPNAEETISYGMPAFKLNGKGVVYFAAFKNHIGFYPTPSGTETFKKELSSYKTSKGTAQFPLDQDLPLELVRKIVRFRVKETLEKKD